MRAPTSNIVSLIRVSPRVASEAHGWIYPGLRIGRTVVGGKWTQCILAGGYKVTHWSRGWITVIGQKDDVWTEKF